MKISQFRSLISVVEHGNFSSAALELGVSQSTVSHAIATLEEELGVVLLVRGRHGASLTAIGEQVLQDARQIMQLLETIQQKAMRDRGLQSGQVRIASIRSIDTHILPEVIVQFRHKFPMIQVMISEYDHYSDVEQALRERRADIGVTMLPTSAEFEAWEWLRDEFVVLLPPETLPPEATLSWEQLANASMIVTPTSPTYYHTRAIFEHFAKFGYKLNVAYEVKSDSTVIGMVQRGLGIAVMARLAAEPIPADIQIRPLPVPLERVIGVVMLADALLPKAAFAFLDVLKAMRSPQQQRNRE